METIQVGCQRQPANNISDNLTDGNAFEVDWGDGFKITGSQDYDGDGVSCVLDWDSDNDNLSDGLETGPNGYYSIWEEDTDPADLDTDDDGLPDGWIDGWGYDADEDGHAQSITGWGYYNATDGESWITEGEDLNLSGCVDIINGYLSESNPREADTDADTLYDGEEIVVYRTFASNAYSSGGSRNDAENYFQVEHNLYMRVAIFGVEAYMNDFDGDISNRPDFAVKVTYYFDSNGETDGWEFDREVEPTGSHIKRLKNEEFATYLNSDGERLFFTSKEKINDVGQYIKVKIRLLEMDGGDNYNTADITEEYGTCSLELYYDFATGLWSDIEPGKIQVSPKEGAYFDPTLGDEGQIQFEDLGRSKMNGIGYSKGWGDDDGFKGAGIYFGMYPWKEGDPDLQPGDKDNDGLSTRAEAEFWKTYPDITDSDNDGIKDWDDKIYGLFTKQIYWKEDVDLNDIKPGGDPDKDGIVNSKELANRIFGANPNRKELFIEIDHMAGMNFGDDELYKITMEYLRNDIGIHFDIDYSMAYGQVFVKEESMNIDRIDRFLDPGEPDLGFTPSRRGTFYYWLIVNAWDGCQRGDKEAKPITGGAVVFDKIRKWTNQDYGQNWDYKWYFMHEFGHYLMGELSNPDWRSEATSAYSNWHTKWSDCVMYESNPASGETQGHRSNAKYWKYHSELWEEIHNELSTVMPSTQDYET